MYDAMEGRHVRQKRERRGPVWNALKRKQSSFSPRVMMTPFANLDGLLLQVGTRAIVCVSLQSWMLLQNVRAKHIVALASGSNRSVARMTHWSWKPHLNCWHGGKHSRGATHDQFRRVNREGSRGLRHLRRSFHAKRTLLPFLSQGEHPHSFCAESPSAGTLSFSAS